MSSIEDQILSASILIVDDQPANVTLLMRLLTEAGYTRVESTMDPTEVCSLHRQHGYDLILLDLHMPVLDGFGVMAGLKADTTDAYLPVIVLTAQPGHKLRALQAGARDFISKPFDLSEVRTRIHNMLEVRRLYSRLAAQNAELERQVLERTAELRASEARYRGLAELAADWHWEQDEEGTFTKASGPAREILGLSATGSDDGLTGGDAAGWDMNDSRRLQAFVAARRPFIDFFVHRKRADGSQQQFRVSGEPMFDEACRFVGYRGVGVEVGVEVGSDR